MKLLKKIKSLFQKSEGDFGKEKAHIEAGQNTGSKNVGKEVFRKTGHTLSAGQASSYVPDKEKIGADDKKGIKKRSNVIDTTLENLSKTTKSKKKRANAIQPTKMDVEGKRSPLKKHSQKPFFKKKVRKDK